MNVLRQAYFPRLRTEIDYVIWKLKKLISQITTSYLLGTAVWTTTDFLPLGPTKTKKVNNNKYVNFEYAEKSLILQSYWTYHSYVSKPSCPQTWIATPRGKERSRLSSWWQSWVPLKKRLSVWKSRQFEPGYWRTQTFLIHLTSVGLLSLLKCNYWYESKDLSFDQFSLVLGTK